MSQPTLAGRLLVATPLIGDPTFERTVILLLGHGSDGAIGVVLNRPSDRMAGELLPDWGAHVAEPGVLFIGGPVATDGVIGIGPDGTVDLNADPDELAPEAAPVRLFAGSAGWGSGQLEGELGERAWWVVDTEPGDVLTSDPSGLWTRVLRRQPSPTAWFAHFPPSPTVN